MGTKISTDEPHLGDVCEWFVEPLKTPNKIYAYYWELVTCPARKVAPNMHLFPMFQDDEVPCLFRNEAGPAGWDSSIQFHAGAPRSTLFLINLAAGKYFEGDIEHAAAEHDIFDNKNVGCDPVNYAVGGNAFIIWKQAAVDLINSVVLPTESNILFEIFVTDEGKPVYKFCFPKYSMNVKLLISP